MATQKITSLLKDYNFSDEYEYYEYIITSYINGNFKQVDNLFKSLQRIKKNAFMLWALNKIQYEHAGSDYFSVLKNRFAIIGKS